MLMKHYGIFRRILDVAKFCNGLMTSGNLADISFRCDFNITVVLNCRMPILDDTVDNYDCVLKMPQWLNTLILYQKKQIDRYLFF